LNFNFIRDIAPVAGLLRMSLVVLVNPSLSAKTLPEFIDYAKANPGKVNIAVPGNGSGPHVAGELFKMMAEINIVNVPYRGPAPAFTDLISGQVQVMFVALPAAIGYIRVMPETEARPRVKNRHGGAPRGERSASWDARRLARRLACRVMCTPHGCSAEHPNVSRRSAHPRFGVSEARLQNPGRKCVAGTMEAVCYGELCSTRRSSSS